jgi:outer membrane protein TolC
MSRQTRSNRRASYVGALVALRDSERQAAWFETTVLPAAEQALASTRPAFAAGSATLVELLDAQASLLDVRRTLAMARIEREKRLAEIEELAGLDLETLSASNSGGLAQRSTDSHE